MSTNHSAITQARDERAKRQNLEQFRLEKMRELVDSFTYPSGYNFRSQFLTAIAWDSYPSDAFTSLVGELRAKGLESLADALDEWGIDFEVVAKGDRYKASGFLEVRDLGVCTEEWHESLGSKHLENILGDDRDSQEWEIAREAIANFEEAIAHEVEQEVFQSWRFRDWGQFYRLVPEAIDD